jgi:shikimate kinase
MKLFLFLTMVMMTATAYTNLILIGMPDSGKSFLGKHLAETLDIPYYDTDELHPLIKQPKFSKQDWHRFRKTECTILQNLLNKQETKLISTGGGCIEYPLIFQQLLNRPRGRDAVVHIVRNQQEQHKDYSKSKSTKNLPDKNYQRLWEKRGRYYFMLSDADYWNEEHSTPTDFVHWWLWQKSTLN